MRVVAGLMHRLMLRRLSERARQLALLAGDPLQTVYPTMMRIPDPDLPRNVVVVTPHADDETFGAAGTIIRHVAAGDSVSVVLCSDNSDSVPFLAVPDAERIRLREGEFLEAMELLGVQDTTCLRIPSARFHPEALSHPVADSVFENDIGVLYLPSMFDNHAQHRVLNLAIARAAAITGRTPSVIRGFEVWSPLPATEVVDITSVIEAKRAAIRKYHSQLSHIDYEHHIAGLNAYRALTLGSSARYAEAFLSMPGSAYLDLAHRILKP